MPQYFKGLATISIWTLWIFAWVIGLGTLAMGIQRGTIFGAETPPMSAWVGFSVALFVMFLSVLCMKIRSMLE